jgi:hypothetical protein
MLQNRLYVAHTSTLSGDTKGTEGSNLARSATQSATQRKLASILAKLLEMAAISRILPANWTGESVPLYCAGDLCSPFLWRAYWQSGFKTPWSERNAITNR